MPQQINRLIAQLGDPDFSRRETAEKQLTEIGPVAFEPLKKAINHQDMEIVIRAERILLKQGQQAAGRQGTSGTPNTGAAKTARAANARVLVNEILRIFGN